MKNFICFISLFLACTMTTFAQAPSYTVGGVAVEDMDAELISVGFHRFWGTTAIAVTVSFGQACMAEQRLTYNQRYLQSCNGLVDPKGQLVIVPDYISGLNIFERMGWTLIQVVPLSSDGDSKALDHQYIFRKKRT